MKRLPSAPDETVPCWRQPTGNSRTRESVAPWSGPPHEYEFAVPFFLRCLPRPSRILHVQSSVDGLASSHNTAIHHGSRKCPFSPFRTRPARNAPAHRCVSVWGQSITYGTPEPALDPIPIRAQQFQCQCNSLLVCATLNSHLSLNPSTVQAVRSGL